MTKNYNDGLMFNFLTWNAQPDFQILWNQR